MTVALTGTGGIFTRWGVLGGTIRNAYGYLASTAPSPGSNWGSGGAVIAALDTNIANIYAQYASNEQTTIGNLYTTRDNLRSSAFTSLYSEMASEADKTLQNQVDRDVTLTSFTDAVAMAELIRQVKNSSDSVKKPTITITPANGTPTPTGTPVVAGSVTGPDGVQMDYIFNEVVDLVCTADSYTGGAALGQEAFSFVGDAKVNYADWNWPKGSGANSSVGASSALAAINTGGNLLANSGFDTYTVANTPDSWTINVGAAGTNVFSSTNVYGSGAKSLEITGDAGLTLTSLYQSITTLLASNVYALNAFVHVDAAAPAAGKLVFELVDNTGTIINDDAGTANRYTVDITQASLQTTYVATGAMTTTQLNGASVAGGAGAIFFRMPKTWIPGATARLQIRLSTAITNTKNVFIDHACLTLATQLYGAGIGGGPYIAAFSGTTALVNQDRFKFTVSNGYQSQFQNLLWRWFDMPTLGQQMPSASGNTINENLIT